MARHRGVDTAKDLFDTNWEDETTRICKIPTYRGTDLDKQTVNANLITIRDDIISAASDYDSSRTTKFRPFQWVKIGTSSYSDPTNAQCLEAEYWIFGLRFGAATAQYKISMICHLDTVPAATSGSGWKPFDPQVVPDVDYSGGTQPKQDFLVGRGCVDDKGPAISAFIVARALLDTFDGSDLLNNTMVELIFDTSEETLMSTPQYIDDNPEEHAPDFGIVYDAMWCVRAEKGCERPVFTVPGAGAAAGPLYISSLITSPDNSTNTIPDWAKAEVKGDEASLQQFYDTVKSTYDTFMFDDENYIRAPFTVSSGTDESGATVVTLKTDVLGAQHGSAPEENRANGANPFVSLANFLAGLVSDGTLGKNSEAAMVQFIRWMWGTKVFGEAHDDLYKSDDVFRADDNNGTTYGVTKCSVEEGNVKLELDIRYAIPHNKMGWDGVSEGLLDKPSIFEGIFNDLTFNFNKKHPKLSGVSVCTETIFAPDIRVPETNDTFQRIESAFQEVMEYQPPRLAIGGGTDAKGYTFLFGVGPLFAKQLGPPINYHGIDEGAPMVDMGLSTQILFNIMAMEIENGGGSESAAVRLAKKVKALKRIAALRANGFVPRCNH